VPRERGAVTPLRSSPRPSRARRLGAAPAVVVLILVLLAVGGGLGGPATSVAAGAAERAPASASAPGQEPSGEPNDDSLPIPEVSTDDANRRADEILDDPKFDEPPKSVIERIFEWIAEQLDKIPFPDFGVPGGGGGEVIGWIFIALLAVLAAFLLSKTTWSRRRRRDEPDFVVGSEVVRTQHEWVSEAERYEAEGQWKQALRCRFRALVGALVDRGVVRDIPGRTTGEYRVEVGRNAPAVAAPFAGTAELFDRAWYGDESTGPDENRLFRALADEVVLGVEAQAADREAPVGAGSFEAPS
jgi:hypothetical protein